MKYLESRLTRYGKRLGLLIPDEVTAKHDLKPGNRVIMVDTKKGILFGSGGSELVLKYKLQIARRGMRRYRNALAELAK
jgi:hypothetical protein